MGSKSEYKEAAKSLGDYFVEKQIELVYGGADVGLMKVIADAVLAGGIKVTGIMPHLLIDKEVDHKGISEMITVDTMAERKELMAELSDGFIAMPGGFGTLDELSEVLTYNQLRISDKPMGLLNTGGYFDNLIKFIEDGVEAGFIRMEHRENLIIDSDIHRLVVRMNAYEPIVMKKWIEDIKVESNGSKKK